MTEKTVKRVVTHPRFYFAVGGKLQRLEVGTELTLSVEEAERLKNKVADPSKLKQLAGGKLVGKGEAGENVALQELGRQLAASQEENKKLLSENAALKKRSK